MNFESITEARAIVMGPGEDLSPSNILTLPKLRPDIDKLLWREAVFEWAETIQACANGGDSRAKEAAATLVMPLYRSLEFSKKQLVKKALRTGELVLTPQTGDTPINQIEVVKKVVNIVAKDSTVDRLRRIVRLYKDITCCKRHVKESISAYIERFAGPALSYLNLTKSDQGLSDSQNFAIILLLNAGLSSQTFTNIITNLVVSAKNKSTNATSIITLSKDRMSKVTSIITAAMKGKLEDDHKILCSESVIAIESAIKQQERYNDCEDMCSWIGLQDAICALEEAALEDKDLHEKKGDNPQPTANAYLITNKDDRKGKKRRREYQGNKRFNGHKSPRNDQEGNKKVEVEEDEEPKKKPFTLNKHARNEKYGKDKKKAYFQ